MTITTLIKPLCDELVHQKFPEFIKENEFLRVANELGLTTSWTEACNEESSTKKSKNDPFSALFDPFNYENVLASFLNKLYNESKESFPGIIVELVIYYLGWTPKFVVIDGLIMDLRYLGISPESESKLKIAWARHDNNILKKVQILKSHLTGRAAKGYYDADEFIQVRRSLINQASVKGQLPEYVLQCSTIEDFWQYIKPRFDHYHERREFIRESFAPLIHKLEQRGHTIENAILIDDHYIDEVWQKALSRMNEDPEAAITSARTLLETVCKHILDNSNQPYDDTIDLPKLYKTAATGLNLSPDQHTEQVFKQILGGCQAIVDGLGSMRNKLSDAHGKSQKRVKPSARHAALAVNLSGSMCQFLLQSFESKTRVSVAGH